MRLTAMKKLRYLGVSYKPDDEFEAEGRWADLLQRANLARVNVTAEDAPRARRGRPKGSTNKPRAEQPEQPDVDET